MRTTSQQKPQLKDNQGVQFDKTLHLHAQDSTNTNDKAIDSNATTNFKHSFGNMPIYAAPLIQTKLSANAAINNNENQRALNFSEMAALGLNGTGVSLPYLKLIQSSFGNYDLSNVRTYLGPHAKAMNDLMGSEAYATGENIAFAGTPTLHTAAHEAAHVVQQRNGVHLKNNVGEPGDDYEKHANAVADIVVQGKQAEPVLKMMPDHTKSQNSKQPVQLQSKSKPNQIANSQKMPEWQVLVFQKMFLEWFAYDKIKSPIVMEIAKKYVNRPGIRFNTEKIVMDMGYGEKKIIPAHHEPTIDRIYWALYPAIDLKKTGKGDVLNDWSFKKENEPELEKKSDEEKLLEIGKFGSKKAVSEILKKKPVLNLGIETIMSGEVTPTSVLQFLSEKPVAEWIAVNILKVSTKVAAKAISGIGWFWLAYDIGELLLSLNELEEKKLSPYQMENARIVADVKAYLAGKQRAAAFEELLKKPLEIKYNTAVNDKTRVSK